MATPRLARAILRAYPRAWRARYADEVLALVEDSGFSARQAVDLAVGAAGAWGRVAAGEVRELALAQPRFPAFGVMRERGGRRELTPSWKGLGLVLTVAAAIELAAHSLGAPWRGALGRVESGDWLLYPFIFHLVALFSALWRLAMPRGTRVSAEDKARLKAALDANPIPRVNRFFARPPTRTVRELPRIRPIEAAAWLIVGALTPLQVSAMIRAQTSPELLKRFMDFYGHFQCSWIGAMVIVTSIFAIIRHRTEREPFSRPVC